MFNDKINVAKGFQTSVNIAYDLNNTDKISGFIPTMSSFEIIEDVLLSTAPNSTERARIFIGAYGRGKSHIILVLLSLLYKKDKSLFAALLEKMKICNLKLYDYTNEFIDSDRKFLPIVVGGSSASLTQSFLFALQKALDDENLSDIMPETHFMASVNAIESWKNDYPETYNKLLESLNEPIEQFILSLKEYNVEACLDEGVNIPKIKTAFILASTTNPKEYIQRRGRVLRLAEGKEYAEIYDFVTLPYDTESVTSLTETQVKRNSTLVKNELRRVEEFSRIAVNMVESASLVDEIKDAYGIQELNWNNEEEDYGYGF